ncbi:hypothetical protein L1987_33801 [Smallanthus sonchifolius]|uniref:Uncharacterized protein n=1 Tax=Smallanthus sonchifolius TaxID=185202 RepID=A0ACB9HRV3_9ASTR|nr:hypothetical protein L1987_33801 [Smallanthus sonchifolius]
MNLTRLERQGGDGGCGSAFLVDKSSSDEGRLSDPFVPVSLLWTLLDVDYDQVTCCHNQIREGLKVDTGNGTTLDTWKCSYYMPFEGTSYLIDGCDDTEECARCEGDKGYCDYISIYDVDGLAKEWNFTCRRYDRGYNDGLFNTLTIAIIVGVSLTSFLEFSKKEAKVQSTKVC